MADLRIQYAKTTDGVDIAFAVFGDGSPLVYAPGAYGLGVHYYSEMPYSRGNVDGLVATGFRVVRYDSRGTGSSDRDNLDFSLDTSVLDLEAVVERAGLDRFALAGHFGSAQPAIAYAAKHPDRITHLILRDPVASEADQDAVFPAYKIIAAMLPLAKDNWELVSLNAAVLSFGFSDLDVAKGFAAAIREGITVEGFMAQEKADFDRFDVTGLLSFVRVPTLVVVDTAFPGRSEVPIAKWRNQMGKIAAAIPDARLEVTGDFAAATAAFVGVGKDKDKVAERTTDRVSALQTVLFTDLVGHTEMMSRLGDDRGRDVLREHERITREVLKANGGTEVKTMGDGFMASFGSVTKAVECAVALQRAFSERGAVGAPLGDGGGAGGAAPSDAVQKASDEQNRGVDQGAASSAPTEPLSVRVGLNAGEPIEEDGDLFGATVILASRIAAKADGGEILVADTVRGLCSGKGFLFADRGEFVAKGFEEPVRVYEVSWRG